MTPRAKVLQVVSDGKVVAVEPEVLTVAGAAVFCGCSPGYLNQLRAADAKRLQRGVPIEGPQWRLLKFGIRYRVSDLRIYLERTGVAGGVMESRRRAKLGFGNR